jgi:hypothetical protein
MVASKWGRYIAAKIPIAEYLYLKMGRKVFTNP